MNKKLFIIAAATVSFAACSNETLIDDVNSSAEIEIGFNTFTDAQTKAGTENNNKDYAWNLEDHHNTFSVWSTKLVAETYIPVHGDGKVTNTSATPKVGEGVVVTWNDPTASVWNPASKKYWDKAATSYEFYAAAPSSAAWVINNGKDALDNATTNYQNAYFTIKDFTLAGTNLTSSAYAATTADGAYKKSWRDAGGDVDLMIAAPCTKSNISSITAATQTVDLQFIHILSRLNVAFKKSTALNDAAVKVTEFQVVNLVKGGDFDESKTAAADGSARNCHWTTLANNKAENLVKIQGVKTDDVLASDESYYTIQSLVIPQNVEFEALARNGSDKTATSKPYIYVRYTIDGEPFEAYINLADAFGKVKYTVKTGLTVGTSSVVGLYTKPSSTYVPAYGTAVADVVYYEKVADGVLAFNEGWQNNLTVTLDALEILFDATVSEWGDNVPSGEVNVD